MKIFSVLQVLLFFALSSTASALTILYPVEVHEPPLELKSQTVDVTINGPLAQTNIQQVFHNSQPRQIEGVYLVTLPADAQITDFVMTINGVKQHGEVLRAEEARKTYTDIVRRMRDPGLLEHVKDRTYRIRVFPIPANGDMPVQVTFAQPVGKTGDFYSYHLAATTPRGTSGKPKSELKVVLNWNSELGAVYSPTHEIEKKENESKASYEITVPDFSPAGDVFQLYFAPAEEGVSVSTLAYRPRNDEPGYFMLMLNPPRDSKSEETVKTVTFVLDVSGSMATDGKIEKARNALEQALGGLNATDSFNIITFSTGVDAFRETPILAGSENLAAAREFVKEIRARGGTNIEGALMRALDQEAANELHQIVFITDGHPTVGTTDVQKLMKRVELQNSAGLRVFAVGVGYDINTSLIDKLAEKTRAIPTYIEPNEDIEVKIGQLTESIASPVMVNMKLDVKNVNSFDVYPQTLPDLFAGQQFLVFGRYRDAAEGSIILTGEIAGKKYEKAFSETFPEKTAKETEYVANLWASRKVGYLLEQIREKGEEKELKDEVIELAERFNLVTPFTSYLIIDDSEVFPSRFALAPRVDNLPAVIISDRADPFAAPAPSREERLRQHEAQVHGSIEERARGAFSYDAPSGTSPQGDVWRSRTGETGVRTSKAVTEMKSAQTTRGVRASNELVRTINGAKFLNENGIWTQQGDHENLTIVKVQYLSDAYFDLMKQFPESEKAITLGEKVKLVLDGKLIVIGEEGIDATSELMKAFGR